MWHCHRRPHDFFGNHHPISPQMSGITWYNHQHMAALLWQTWSNHRIEARSCWYHVATCMYIYIYTHAFVCSMEGASLPTRDHHRYWPKVDLPHFSMISLHSHVYLLKMYTPIILHYIASSTYLIVFPWDPHENTTSSALGRTWGAERVAFFLLLRMLKFSDWP